MPLSRSTREIASETPWVVTLALLALPVAAQGTWTPPFNHNEAHGAPGAGIATWSHPYAPWGAQVVQTVPMSQSSAWSPTAGLIPPAGMTLYPVWQWPSRFNAVHMALIPKGRYRGMVLVWDSDPVLANHPPQFASTPANQYLSFQPYAIIDPADSPTVWDPLPGGNQAFRYRNFLLPMSNLFAPTPTSGAPDGWTLFCSGHAWSPFGDLVVAGGTIFNVSSPPVPLYHGDGHSCSTGDSQHRTIRVPVRRCTLASLAGGSMAPP
jgi:hypothetical protein